VTALIKVEPKSVPRGTLQPSANYQTHVISTEGPQGRSGETLYFVFHGGQMDRFTEYRRLSV